MDPNEAYNKLKKISWAAKLAAEFAPPVRAGDAALLEMAEAFEALDLWLCKGGFAPQQWQDSLRRFAEVKNVDPS